MKKITLVLSIIFSCASGLLYAQQYSKVDDSTVAITTNQSISDIQLKIDAVKKNIAIEDKIASDAIAPLQAQIDQAANQGVASAVPLASADVQASIAAKAVVAEPMQPAQPLDVQGTTVIQ